MTSPGLRPLLLLCALVVAIESACAQSGCVQRQAASGVVEEEPDLEKSGARIRTASVSGHVEETNVGRFDLVDGLAYRKSEGGGTVIVATSKAIVAPAALAQSPCPATYARALTLLRGASHVEVSVGGTGSPEGIAIGAPDGSSAFAGGLELGLTLDVRNDTRIAGRVARRVSGSRYRSRYEQILTFDLPVWTPGEAQMREIDFVDGIKGPDDAATPTEEAVRHAYSVVRTSAADRNLNAWLQAQGFDASQSAAIRAIPGIRKDFATLAEQFLTPGTPDQIWVRPGIAGVEAEGTNGKGEKYRTGYYFLTCRTQLVLVRVAGSPL
jgi:hypothetical protein